MFERFTDRARRVVVFAQEEAGLLGHNYIGTEHLLLGLVHDDEGVARQALSAVRAQVEEIIGQGQVAPTGHMPFTPRAKKVLELSLREALQLGHSYIGTEHILLGLVREGEGVAAQVLQQLGADLDLDRVRRTVTQLLQGYEAGEVAPGEAVQTDPKELVRKTAERARRARELSERLATSLDDPSVTADDVFYGFLVMAERLLGLEVVARRLEERDQPAEGEGEGKTGEES